MMAMKLKGRVMKGASSLPIEFRRALETNTLKIDFIVRYLRISIKDSIPGKCPQAHSDPEMNLVVRDEVEEGGEHGAEQGAVEGVHPAVHHGGGVQAQHMVSQSGDEA